MEKERSKKMIATFESSLQLKKAFSRMKKAEGLSLRSWAGELSLSPTLVSQVINGKKLGSLTTVMKLGRSLEMDPLDLLDLQEALERDWLRKKGIEPRKELPSRLEVEKVILDDEVLLKSWLNLALLEFTTCDNFKEDLDFLSEKFQAPRPLIRMALNELKKSGFVKHENGQLRKQTRQMRIPTHRSRKIVREFHSQMLDKAKKELCKDGPEDFAQRLITGYTIAGNPARLEEAKTILQKALIDIAQVLCEGECTEIYQLQSQLFKLSK